uniref:Uncharacterized protein n=1 Tax=viral metagenome TaxID=1070528 RepID=A0A6M3X7J7_9ZZZZ
MKKAYFIFALAAVVAFAGLVFSGEPRFYGSTVAQITSGTIDGTAIGGTTPAAGAFTTLDSSDKVHHVITAGHPFIVGGDTIATLGTVAISNANPSVLTKDATIDDGLAVGDAVIVNSGTNATVGTYFVVSIVVNTSVTLDRQAATGACADGNVTYVNDPALVSDSGKRLRVGNAVTVDSSGNVGIGTTAPTNKLTVNGNVELLGSGSSLTFENGLLGFSYVAGFTHLSQTGGLRVYLDANNNDTTSNFEIYGDVAAETTSGALVTVTDLGNVGIGTSTVDRKLHAEEVNAATAAAVPIIRASVTSTGTPAAGLGPSLEFEVETAAGAPGNQEVVAAIDGIAIDVTGASEDGAIVFKTMKAGAAATEDIRIEGGRLRMAETTDSPAVADHAFLYAKDVTAVGELFAADAAATATQLTSHNFSGFEPDPTERFPWSFYAESKALGVKINVDMAGAIRAVEALSGKSFIYYEDIPKSVDLEAAYRAQWISEYIEKNTAEAEVIKEDAFEMVEVDERVLYEVEVIDKKTGKIKIIKQPKQIGEKLTGYNLINGEVKPNIEIIYETKKVLKSQLKADVRFDTTDGKFYKKIIPTQLMAEEAAVIGFKFTLPAWMMSRLVK